jgi:hypothetical protein
VGPHRSLTWLRAGDFLTALFVGEFHYNCIMSKTRQISITLPEELIDTIRAAVERGEARSVSAYIAGKLAPGLVMDALFAEWDAERGAPSAAVGKWADRELDRAFAEQAAHNRGDA